MLHIDPHKRLAAGEVLKHPWVAMRDNLPHMRLTLQDAQVVKVTYNQKYTRSRLTTKLYYRLFCALMDSMLNANPKKQFTCCCFPRLTEPKNRGVFNTQNIESTCIRKETHILVLKKNELN